MIKPSPDKSKNSVCPGIWSFLSFNVYFCTLDTGRSDKVCQKYLLDVKKFGSPSIAEVYIIAKLKLKMIT